MTLRHGLSKRLAAVNKTELSKQVEETVKTLRNKRTGVQAAQEKLSKLREEVQAQKSQLAENELDQAFKTISKLSENSNLLSGADTAEIASELEKLADQMDGLTAAQRAELGGAAQATCPTAWGQPRCQEPCGPTERDWNGGSQS